MASLDGISFDVTTRQVSRTILSSVGGFSQAARQNIHSLQDLLATIQRFNLQVFDSRTLPQDAFVGEGVSYKVSRCVHTRTNKIYARKDVKLLAKDAESGAFERQVACVLRDVEVMCGLAKRSNILDIFGYGWDIESGNVIPFLVTDFSAEGTLRQFLKNNQLSVHEKLLFCRDVAQGLHSLHVAGIAHGDLKLDNVLVTPYVASGFTPQDQDLLRTTGFEACISDFGHSLHLYDDEGDSRVKQRYGGTLAYNAPEILDKGHKTRENINFRKCDVWSLGLACWEILIDGKAYYHTADVEDSILTSQKRSAPNPTPPPSNPPSQGSSSALVEELVHITPQLAGISCKEIMGRISDTLTPREIRRLHFLFNACLEPDATKRLADIPQLPFFQGQRTTNLVPTRIYVGAETSWSYKLFGLADQIPNEVRRQIASDCEKIANEPGKSILTARACFQLALVYATGFGVEQDRTEAVQWFERSSEKGFRLAELYLPALRSVDPKDPPTHDHCLRNYLECNRRAVREKFASSSLTLADSTIGLQDIGLEQLSIQMLDEKSTYEGPDGEGNSMLLLSAKFGLIVTANWLLDKDASAPDFDKAKSAPLHWLFMFPEEDIKRISTRFVAECDRFIFAGELQDKIAMSTDVNTFAYRHAPFQVDPQLPLSLGGTPLAMATLVHCVPAVKALLELGASPLVGLYQARLSMNVMCAIGIAFRFHMAEPLDLMLEHLMNSGTIGKQLRDLLDTLQQFLPTPEVERAFIHGSHLDKAAQETYAVLIEYYRHAGYEPRTWDLLKQAVLNRAPDLCSAILTAMGSSDEIALQQNELDELMFTCINDACSGPRESALAIQLLEFAIKAGCNINCYPNSNRMPLFTVIDYHRADLLDWILELKDKDPKIDFNFRDQVGNNCLHRMIISGFSSQFPLIKLISKGVSTYACNHKNQLPIDLIHDDSMAKEYGTLLSFTPLNVRTKLLRSAVIADAPKLVSTHLQICNDSGGNNRDDLNNALYLTTKYCSGQVAEHLISCGANPNHKFRSDMKIIHIAAQSGNIDVLNMCLETGYYRDRKRHTGAPLVLAISTLLENDYRQTGARACCDALLKDGTGPICMDSRLRTPLAIMLQAPKALRTRHITLIEALLERGADPNECESLLVEHSLSMAINEEDFNLADLLVKYGISVHRRGKNGEYPLHGCARLSADLSLNATGDSRPARLALELLKRGANPFSKNQDGLTPLELAIRNSNGPVTMAMVQHIMQASGTSHEKLQSTRSQESTKRRSSQRLFRNIMKNTVPAESPVPTQPQQIPSLQEGWGLAVFSKNYICMCAFLRAHANGPTTYLTRNIALRLLYYALRNDLSDVIVKFIGGETDGGFESPDEYFKTVWDSIREYFPWKGLAEDLTSIPQIHEYFQFQWGFTQGHFPLEDIFYNKFIVNVEAEAMGMADEELPKALVKDFYYVLQYANASDGYSRELPASHMFARNYIEVQREPGMVEACIDLEEQARKDRMRALQSILGTGDEELTFTHDSGF